MRPKPDAIVVEWLDRQKDLCFDMRVKGSHHMFRKEAVIEKINLRREGNKAKPYQVKQVRNVIVKYKLGGTDV